MKKSLLFCSGVLLSCVGVQAKLQAHEQAPKELVVDSDAPLELTKEQKLQLLTAQAVRMPKVVDAYKQEAASVGDIMRLAEEITTTVNSIEPQGVTVRDILTCAALPWLVIAAYLIHQVTS
jgi:hypothetical protein